MLESMCRCMDDGLRRRARFKEEAYRITIDEVAREANVETNMGEIENLMQFQRRKYWAWLKLGRKHGGALGREPPAVDFRAGRVG